MIMRNCTRHAALVVSLLLCWNYLLDTVTGASESRQTAAGLPPEGTLQPFLGEPQFDMQQVFPDDRFPTVVVATDGTVLAFWNGVIVRRSRDGGATWGDEIVVGKGFMGGGVTVDENTGHILAFVESGHPPAEVFIYRSTDQGLTWQAQETVIHPDSNGHGPSMHMNEHGITLRHGPYRGRLLRPTRWYAGKNDSERWPQHYTNAIYSDDGGKTWHTSDPFPANGTGEAALAELADGRIAYNSRRHWAPEGENPRRRWTAWSEDGGQTWQDLAICDVLPDGDQVRDYGLMGGLVRLPVRDRDILVFSNIESADGRHHGTVWASFDGGRTWPIKRLVYEGTFAYSSLNAGRPGTPGQGWIYLLFEGGPEGGGTLARFNLSWLLQGERTGDGDLPEWRWETSHRIKPQPGHPWYWQYNGRPVILLGASKQDNLFQIPDLEAHLDLLASVGGNYIRNVMSSRDTGNIWPFHRLPNGKYDLERYNPAYWRRFENLLEWTFERDIIVQIELWDQFDYQSKVEDTEGLWEDLNPYNPNNNINYTVEQTGLAAPLGSLYGKENGFFRSVPALENNQVLLRYQQRQVDRILELSLPYPHVLYTIDNETHGPQEWGQYWARYIYTKARALDVDVYVTEMWNKRELLSSQQRQTLDHPDLYPFVDISQNSRNKGQTHWDNIVEVRGYLRARPRPLNNVKIYGGMDAGWGSGTARDGMERFWRDIIGGCASARMHRPDYGLGLSEASQAAIRSARMLLAELDIFQCQPDGASSLLLDRQDDEAYLTCIPGRQYAVYFTDGGHLRLDLKAARGSFLLKWLDIMNTEWVAQTQIQAGRAVTLQPPGGGHWVALLLSQQQESAKPGM